MIWVVKRILLADPEEIDIVLQTVRSWHKQRFPEYELEVLSLPTNNWEERKRQIDMVTYYLKQWDENTKR